jgi:hypothetical protein
MVRRSLLVVTVCLSAFAVPATAQDVPAGPTNLRVTDVRASGATLAWDAPSGAEVYSYFIRDLDAAYDVGASFTSTGTAALKPRTTYRLAVRALLVVDGLLVESRSSNAVTLTTPPDTMPPTTPSARPESQTATSVSLRFGGSTDDVGIETWVISDGTRTWTQSAAATWRFGVGDLETNRTHTFTVRARDAAGNLSPPSNPVTFELENQPPSAPDSLRVDGDELVWDASTDNVGILQYVVFVDGDPHPFEETTATRVPLRFCDDPVNPTYCWPSLDQPHTYVVRARDHSRNLSPPSEPLVVPAH